MAWRLGAGRKLSAQGSSGHGGRTWSWSLLSPSRAPLKSVFKHYDSEGRGTISREDFERLSGNFPFACHGLHPPPCQG